MELQKNRIAIVSPSQNAYSETFIQEQKKGLSGKVFYYYGGEVPNYLEGFGKLDNRSTTIFTKLKHKLRFRTLSIAETAFIHSLKKNKIQVVLAQYGTTANQLINVCKKLNIPLITHFHGYDASVYSVIEKCDNYKKVFEYSTFVIAVSLAMQKKLIELGCPKEKIIYNTYGPDNLFLNLIPQNNSTTFIGVGRFVNKKAPYYTILAFEKAHKKFPEARMVLAGTGELFETCNNLIRTLHLENKIIVPGIITREEFVNYLSNALAFVQHSVTTLNGDQEGTPVAILEASASGIPVISTIHAGIPDVIIDGVTGLLVDEHDVDAMAEKMILLLSNTKYAKELGSNGKERIKTNFTMKRHLEVIDDLIEKAIRNANE